MRIKIKENGLLMDKKKAHRVEVKEVFVKKAQDKSLNVFQIFFKGKKSSGILEISGKEYAKITGLLK